MTWKKPDAVFPKESDASFWASFGGFGAGGASGVPVGRFPVEPGLTDGSLSVACPACHFAATPPADWISETSTWSCSFERTCA